VVVVVVVVVVVGSSEDEVRLVRVVLVGFWERGGEVETLFVVMLDFDFLSLSCTSTRKGTFSK